MSDRLDNLCQRLQVTTQSLTRATSVYASQEMLLLALEQMDIEAKEGDEPEGGGKIEKKEYSAPWLKNAGKVFRVGGRFASAAEKAAEAAEQAAYNAAANTGDAAKKAANSASKAAGSASSYLKTQVPAVTNEAVTKIKDAWKGSIFQTASQNLGSQIQKYSADAKTGFDTARTAVMEAGKNMTPANAGKLGGEILDKIQAASQVAKEAPDDVVAGGIAYAHMAMASMLSVVDKEKGTKLADKARAELDVAAKHMGAVKSHHKEMIDSGKEKAASAVVGQKLTDLSKNIGDMKTKAVDAAKNTELGKAVQEIADSKEFKDMQTAIGTAVSNGKTVAQGAYDKARASAETHFNDAKAAAANAPAQAQKMINEALSSIESNANGPAVAAAVIPYVKLLATKMGAEPKTVDAAIADIADTVKAVSGNAGDRLAQVSSTVNAKVGQLESNRKQGAYEEGSKNLAKKAKGESDAANKDASAAQKAAEAAKAKLEKARAAADNNKDPKKQEALAKAFEDAETEANSASSKAGEAKTKADDTREYVYNPAAQRADRQTAKSAIERDANKAKFLEKAYAANTTAQDSMGKRNADLAKSREGNDALRKEGKADAVKHAADRAQFATDKAEAAKQAKARAQKAQEDAKTARQEQAVKDNEARKERATATGAEVAQREAEITKARTEREARNAKVEQEIAEMDKQAEAYRKGAQKKRPKAPAYRQAGKTDQVGTLA